MYKLEEKLTDNLKGVTFLQSILKLVKFIVCEFGFYFLIFCQSD